jgi:Oxidation resistance protein
MTPSNSNSSVNTNASEFKHGIDNHSRNSPADNASRETRKNEGTNSSGIMSATKRWVAWQRIKWQRKTLCKAVEEQTKIILHETQKLRQMEKQLDWQNRFDRSLNDNPTFQSLTNDTQHGTVSNDNDTFPATERSSSLGVRRTFCGISLDDLQEDQQEDYIDDASQVSLGSALDPDDVSNKISQNDSKNTEHSYNCYLDSGQEGMFRIRTPRETQTGGMAVQLEFLHDGEDAIIGNQKREAQNLIKVFEEKKSCNVPFILTLKQMTDIAENALPPNVLFSKWKRLYSLQRDGDSFVGAFMKRVQHEDRTLLVVQTTNHEIMGAYSNSPWKGHGTSGSVHFYGSAQASLFSINKDTNEINVYKWTGKNRFIQVCDMQHKLIALGGGGKEGEFGLCIEDDFRIGSTGPCETFDNPQLCSENQFDILNIECWGFVSGFV